MSLHIETVDHQTSFRPGDVVAGKVAWELDAVPKKVEVCVFWYTSGLGDEEAEIADSITLTATRASDTERFALQLPLVPYSFSGRLLTVNWALELIIDPGPRVTRIELVVSPSGDVIAP